MSEYLETVQYGADGPDAPDNFDEYVTFTQAYQFTRLTDLPFVAKARFWKLNDLTISAQTVPGNRAERTAVQQAITPFDHLTMIVLFAGRIDYRSETGQSVCHSGDVLLLDYRRRFDLVSPDQYSAAISISRGAIEDKAGPILLEGRLPDRAETSILHAFVRNLVNQLPTTNVRSVTPIAQILRNLMVMAIKGTASGDAKVMSGAARQRAINYMRMQQPGTLDIDEMSRSLGITRPTLYRLFKADGGIRSFDRKSRLRALHQALCHSDPDDPLSELALRFGFDNMSGLAHMFRKQYGINMSSLRRHVPGRLKADDSTDPLSSYRRSIEALSRKPALGR